ncbi:aromatic acid exporter family protein [Robertmurraya yapensis]|uniref:Aromatic acid exporter family protein n=2 Tax=Bacillaceae TaxID=186817 RepID=A0A3S0KJ52_9BACI|nr:aromatic acid exporter family protein [Bacillus yapensis]RTR27879.1 aromatic acid exporter family protein [Bacillus yapensis]TKS94282.1 aromatic acid exporter family protein [Bacillus yapensis]
MTLGPRVIKTGIAVTLALYICSLFHMESAVFAGVAAIFTIQPSIYRTWKQIWHQVQTNTLGAIIALLALYFLGNDPIAIGLVMIIVILVSLKLKMAETISLTLVTVLAIMSAPGNEDLLFALHRFGIILIGMASALFVNVVIYPPNYRKNFIVKVNEVFQNMSILMRTAISNEMTEKSFHDQMKKLEKDLLKLEEQFKLFDEEREKMAKVNQMDLREIVVFKLMVKSLQQGFLVLESIDDFYFQCKPKDEDDLIFDQQLEHLIKLHELILLKYDGKIKMDEEHQLEEELLNQTSEFLQKSIGSLGDNEERQIPLVVISSAIYQYAFQMNRLDRLIEQYMKRGK